jgi:hypothetical protein
VRKMSRKKTLSDSAGLLKPSQLAWGEQAAV